MSLEKQTKEYLERKIKKVEELLDEAKNAQAFMGIEIKDTQISIPQGGQKAVIQIIITLDEVKIYQLESTK